MAYTTVQKLLDGKLKPVTTQKHVLLREALKLMSLHGYSQLPVVELMGDEERPIGILSETSIVSALTQFCSSVDTLLVSHAMVEPFDKFEFDEDVTVVAERLVSSNVALIVEREALTGIVTTHDIAEYFRKRAVVMMRVEQVETSIRDHVRAAYGHDDQDIATGAARAKNRANQVNPIRLFGAINKYFDVLGTDKPARNDSALNEAFKTLGVEAPLNVSFDDLTLQEYITMLFEADRWQRYAHKFSPIQKDSLRTLLERIRDIRNTLAHFKRDLSDDEQLTLQFCADFFARHEPDAAETVIDSPQTAEPTTSESANDVSPDFLPETQDPEQNSIDSGEEAGESSLSAEDSKYAPLVTYLRKQKVGTDRVMLSFKEIEGIIGAPLPTSARTMRAWWANDTVGHSHSKEWLEADWRVNGVSLSQQQVTFQRMGDRTQGYVKFYNNVRRELAKNSILPLSPPQIRGTNWHEIIEQETVPEIGRSVVRFVYSFSHQGRSRIEVYIDSGDQTINKLIFDRISIYKVEIENEVGAAISWERMDSKRACRIAVYTSGSIFDEEQKLERLIDWCTYITPKFYRALNWRLQEIVESVGKLTASTQLNG